MLGIRKNPVPMAAKTLATVDRAYRLPAVRPTWSSVAVFSLMAKGLTIPSIINGGKNRIVAATRTAARRPMSSVALSTGCLSQGIATVHTPASPMGMLNFVSVGCLSASRPPRA